ncbi:ribosome maturation factor RimM [Legionella dresdenensis]|uniref:Ribosome maturation factor RimM n=1 Tax=Legionella dresdenensis TaxID=450200 RepID=A0ABV8CEJ4_9GAMM
MDKSEDWVVIGRFGKVHGIKGFVTVHSFTEPRDNILRYSEWYAFINKQWQVLNLQRVDVTDKHILALIEGFDEREEATKLTNVEIAVPREHLPELEPGEYYWHQLIGLRVCNLQNEELGEVVDMLATGSNDVLVVEGKKRHLIPYLPDQVVTNVDIDNRLITVDWDADF